MLPVAFASKMFAQAPGKWHPSSAASAAVMRTRCALPFLVGAITGEAATLLSLRSKDWKVARRDPTNIHRTAASADSMAPQTKPLTSLPGPPFLARGRHRLHHDRFTCVRKSHLSKS